MRKKVTMSDIAKALEVSTVTVSKALGNREGVSDSIRERIIHLANEMGYIYNHGDKNEKKDKQYNIGILVHEKFMNDSGNSFYWKIYQHITSSLKQNNSFGILELIDEEGVNSHYIPKIISENKVDGLMLLGQMEENYVEYLYEIGLPMILLDFYNHDPKYESIISDSFYSSYMLTNHLISNGHMKIGFVGDIHATSSILDRYLGYCKALIEQCITLREDYVLCDRDSVGTYINLDLPDEMPTAFVCNCDEVAYLLINRLKNEGLNVPQDISVVGFDDYMFSTLIDPPLTTVAVNGKEMAEIAVATILKKLKGSKKQLGRKIITSNIIYRSSVRNISE